MRQPLPSEMVISLAGTILNEPNGKTIFNGLIQSVIIPATAMALVGHEQDEENPLIKGCPKTPQEVLRDLADVLEKQQEAAMAMDPPVDMMEEMAEIYRTLESEIQGKDFAEKMEGKDLTVDDILGGT